MAKAIDSTTECVDAIISVPETKQITSDFGRKIELDLSSEQMEYEKNMFPLNNILDPSKYNKWQMGYMQHHNYDPDC